MAPKLLFRKECLGFVLGLLMAIHARGQNLIYDAMARAGSDYAEIRKRAEAGDATAQVAFGDILTGKLRHADALLWYRKAADQGNVYGQFHVGRTLLHGALGNPADQSVKADPVQGLGWAFMAATNRIPAACWDMSFALQRGVGTDVDLISAYAWLEFSSGVIGGNRIELNELALKMTTAEVERAKILSSRFKAGYWQFPVIRIIPEGDPRLKLNGITISARQRSANINGQTVLEGETVTLALKPGRLNVTCLKAGNDSVTISVKGEARPRILRLAHGESTH
jgi:hypothetical protein